MGQGHYFRSRLAAVTAAQPDATLQARIHLVTALFGDLDLEAIATASTLSSLFDLCEALSGGGGSSLDLNEAVTAAAAALVFLGHGSPSSPVLRQYVQQVFLPLAAAAAGTPASRQLLHQLAGLLAQHQAWDIGLEMLQCAHGTLVAALEDATDSSRSSSGAACPAQPNDPRQQQAASTSTSSNQGRWQITFQLPPATACVAVEELAAAAVAELQEQQGHATDPTVASMLQLLAGPLFGAACSLLACSRAGLQQASFQKLLPALLAASTAASPAAEQQCMQQLWQQCLSMIAAPALPRRLGLAVLLQYHAAWGLQPPSATEKPPTTDTAAVGGDSSERFWALLRDCLVDGEALNRKRAFRLLQLLLPEQQLSAQPVWLVFLALYELLDEFSPHLVKAAWPQISQLHPPAPQFASEDASADVAHSSKMNQLRRAREDATHKENSQQQQQQQQQQQPQQGEQNQELPMAFCWSSVIWTLALQHKNLQVQRMAMKTLLKRNWSAEMLAQLPLSFLIQTLLPALMSPIHHKVSTAAGLSATGSAMGSADAQQQQTIVTAAGQVAARDAAGSGGGGGSSFDVISQAAELLSSYVAAAGPAAARALLAAGLQVASMAKDLPRSALLAVMRALAAAAKAAVSGGSMLHGMGDSDAAACVEEALARLHSLLVRLLIYSGQTFRVTCFNLLLVIAAAVAPAGACSLAAAARLIQCLPAYMQGPTGQLHTPVRSWLLGGGSSSSTDAGSSHVWLAAGTESMWQQYFSSSSSSTAPGIASNAAALSQQQQQWHAQPQDYLSWRTSCDAWLRLLLCCSDELQPQLAAALSGLASMTEQLTSRSYLAAGAAERTLLMLAVLLEGAEAAGRVAVEAGQPLPLLTSAAAELAEGVAGPLGRCLELYCSCYWSSPAVLAWGEGSSSASSDSAAGPAGAGMFGLCPAAWAAAARAEAAAQAAAAAAVLLGRYAGGCWATCGALDTQLAAAAAAAGPPASRRGLPALLKLLGKMAEVGEQLASRSMPGVELPAAGAGTAAVETRLQQAAAAEQSRASALKVLGSHLATGLSRCLICCPELCSQQLPCSPVSWLQAVLREVAVAQAAIMQWQAVASASASTRSGDPMKGWLKGMDWRCLAAVMTLTAAAAAEPAANGIAAGGTKATAAAASSLGCHVPAGLLPVDAVCDVLSHALDALQWTVSETGSELLHLLRCLRRVWALLVEDEQLQVAAVDALVSAGTLPDGAAASGWPLVPLTTVMSNGLLDLLRGSKKKPQLLYSLAVNALLLPQLCVVGPQQLHLVPLHDGPTAPLRCFIRGLLQQGQKGSPRLMLALALQLGCFVACCPQLLVWYAEELWQLLLFGVSSTGLGAGQDAEVQGLSSLEEGQERSLLCQPLDPELQEAYTLTDVGPRVALLCSLYQLAAAAGLVGHEGSGAAPSEGWVHEVEAAGVGLWDNWLQALVREPVLSGDRFKVGSDVHRLKVRAWQGLAAAANFLSSSRQQKAATAAVKELLVQLAVNQPPSIKQYQEAIVAHLVLQHPALLQELLLPQITSVEKGGAATGSHILIAVQVALHCQPQQQLEVLPQLLKLLLPWTNHHTHHIRTFAQLGFCALLDAKPLAVWPGWEVGLGPGGVTVAAELLRFMHDNTDFQRFRRAMGGGILAWSPQGVTSPRRIFSCSLYLAGAEDTPVTFEGVPEALMDKIITFLTVERAKLREAAVYRVAGYEGGPSTAADGSGANSGSMAAVGDYQRKVSPSERAVLMADVLDELEQQQGLQSGPAGTRRNELIVVASLISKVPNLGGLARTAEVLGAGALVLSDKRVTAEAGFTSVSVTAERWVPIEEVKEAALLSWLAVKQAQGYALVGLEQTAESICLPDFDFPSKTVLVLGREKEGIPPEIISMLDATVEIPQLGVIRSLNVHVSGAIAMYEFTKQQLAARSRN